MAKRHHFILIGGVALLMAACSSSQTSSEGDAQGDQPVVDAGTDPVPMDSAENAAPPPDSVPPPPMEGDAPPPLEEGTTTASNDTPPPAPEAAPVPAEAPAAEPAPVAEAPTPASGGGEPYTVQQGDTLMRIAFETYGDLFKWRQIYDANRDKIQDPNSVPPGTVLMLEKPDSPVQISRNGERYLIKRGDTLGSISEDVYGTKTKWKRIWENNRELIRDPNMIFAGFYLYYTMTPEDQQELERLKSNPESQTPPLAQQTTGAPAEEARGPASVPANAPSFQAPPVTQASQ
ncbi:MAG: LysM peptidoglycan-binding domain-containing protein [Oligoflexia bacterium]|nr:LysM peptidoglycan-binding domain-containing protein [Oligoflexia bacterium]